MEAILDVNWPIPKILFELAVTAPPRVKAFMVRVPVELDRVFVFNAEDSNVPDADALEKNPWTA